MATTKIEWADAVWNPVTGCTPISAGCDRCYARRMANRMKGRAGYPVDNPFQLTFHADRLEDPLKWKKPKRIFVCSMGDLFHRDIPYEKTREVFDVMRRAGNLNSHTFMVLTKRPGRMAEFIARLVKDRGVDFLRWPLPFVWLGVTVEKQENADNRIYKLLQIAAAVRFVSVEPMLGPVDLRYIQTDMVEIDSLTGDHGVIRPLRGRSDNKLNWVIAGGETGSGARPMHPDWVRSLRDQCVAAGVPFFFKQWGEWFEPTEGEAWDGDKQIAMSASGAARPWTDDWSDGEVRLMRVGKKSAGRMLDAREWNEFPKMEGF